MKFRIGPPCSGVLSVVPLVAGVVIIAGCTSPPAGRAPLAGHDHAVDAGPSPGVPAGLAGLDPEDRRLAEAQGFCPIMTDERLGEMGPPVKVVLGGRPVFLCCKGCKKKAEAAPARTLAVVDELKAKSARP